MPASQLITATEWNTHLELVFADTATSNAFGLPAARELLSHVKQYKKWQKPVVVRSGHPRVFCSGGNLSEYKKLKGKAPGLKINKEITSVLDAFGKWPAVKLAVIEGDVFGGGMEWLARFDFRWSTPAAMLAFWQRRIGLTSGWGGGGAWAAIIGEARVRQLLLEARLLSAPEAMRAGIVDRVLTRWSLKEEVEEWARHMEKASAVSGWSVKTESKLFRSLWMGPEHEAVLKRWK